MLDAFNGTLYNTNKCFDYGTGLVVRHEPSEYKIMNAGYDNETINQVFKE